MKNLPAKNLTGLLHEILSLVTTKKHKLIKSLAFKRTLLTKITDGPKRKFTKD